MIDAESLTEFVGKSHPVMFGHIFKLANLNQNDRVRILEEMQILRQEKLVGNSSSGNNRDKNAGYAAVSPNEPSEKNTVTDLTDLTESSTANYSDANFAKLHDLTVKLNALESHLDITDKYLAYTTRESAETKAIALGINSKIAACVKKELKL